MARPRRTPTSRSTDDYRHEDARRKIHSHHNNLFDPSTGCVSLPVEPGAHRRIAVQVIDQRGNDVRWVVGVTS